MKPKTLLRTLKRPKQSKPKSVMSSKLSMISPSSELLNQVAQIVPVTDVTTDQIQTIIEGMLEIAHGKQGSTDRPTLVGLAAPQVGVDKRIIVVVTDADGMGHATEFKVYINPEVTAVSKDTNSNREGCYSTGRVCGILKRPSVITITALDRTGKLVTEQYRGFVARIFQHEIDHLNGIRFPDRITDDNDLLWVKEAEFGNFRSNWQNWPHKCPRTKWQAIKSGEPITDN